MDNKLRNLDFIKTVLMILIVLYHSFCFLGGNWFTIIPIQKQLIPSILLEWLNSFTIYSFVLVSGYLFYYVKYERDGYKRFWPFVLNKVKRLLVPYFIVSFFWCIPISIFFYGFDVVLIVEKYILGTSPEQLWFLLMLFIIFIIFYPISNLVKKNKVLGFIFVLSSYAIGLFGTKFAPNFLQIWTALEFLPFFYIGFFLRQSKESFIRNIPFFIYIFLDLSFFALYYIALNQEGLIWSVLKVMSSSLTHVFGCLMAWYTLHFIANKIQRDKPRTASFLAKRSMVIYLFHQQIIYFSIFFFADKINIYILAFLNFFFSFFVSLLFSCLVLTNSWTSFLVGEKKVEHSNKNSEGVSS